MQAQMESDASLSGVPLAHFKATFEAMVVEIRAQLISAEAGASGSTGHDQRLTVHANRTEVVEIQSEFKSD